MKLKVRARGEILTTKEVRSLVGIKPLSEVIAIITKDGLLIKPEKSIKELLSRRRGRALLKLTVEEFEKLSIETQREILSED